MVASKLKLVNRYLYPIKSVPPNVMTFKLAYIAVRSREDLSSHVPGTFTPCFVKFCRVSHPRFGTRAMSCDTLEPTVTTSLPDLLRTLVAPLTILVDRVN